ncbi:LOW QUALITY PROTEIN: INO80 complex subunit B [Tachyglossus aculeatus]|uniref:LOW QUALITY PROTEIN: INO80 complex subunit B n=1 Tax=Tachyglossus aculeatus TaxID=9261 RepID=UPI0018F4ECE3|nr:LOW QUALITY PROTEIN: INO80 complex subunit B [Tachyglossus aculeatus]
MSKVWRRGGARGGVDGARPDEFEAGGHGGSHKKKHKKHKKKHKKKHHQEEVAAAAAAAGSVGPGHGFPMASLGASPAKPQLKLKIKLGGQILGTKSVPTFTVMPGGPRSPSPLNVLDDEEPMEGVPIEQYRAWLDEDSNLSPSPLRELAGDEEEEEEEEEEERWLEALEKGELDDNGDLKKEIDERLLTARQRALLQKARSRASPPRPGPLAGGPAVPGPGPALTEEMLLKREERARKRRLQAARRAEEHKNQTIERLTKTGPPGARGRGAARGGAAGDPTTPRHRAPAPAPTVRYRSGPRGASLSFPPGARTPGPRAPAPAPPAATCAVPGCPNPRRYACARTGRPLCSLQCYRRNLQLSAAS